MVFTNDETVVIERVAVVSGGIHPVMTVAYVTVLEAGGRSHYYCAIPYGRFYPEFPVKGVSVSRVRIALSDRREDLVCEYEPESVTIQWGAFQVLKYEEVRDCYGE